MRWLKNTEYFLRFHPFDGSTAIIERPAGYYEKFSGGGKVINIFEIASKFVLSKGSIQLSFEGWSSTDDL